jgi:D-3-phosphoglycerate dehydrogenase/(S)-sulfolactate dehydrogenase
MVSAATLAQMKPGALLVNCARGGLVDERAVADALRSKHLGGAALDVFEVEPPPADHPLFSCENFIATPHLGGSTEDAQQNVAVIVCEAMVEYLTTGTIRNAVNVPSVSGEVLERLGPFLRLAEKMGAFAAQFALQGECAAAPEEVEISYAGEVAQHPSAPLTAAVLKGVLRTFLAETVNEISAPALARERGLSVKEVKTSETPDFASLLTLRLRCGKQITTEVSGTIVGKREPRLVRVDGLDIEAVPEGFMVVIHNNDAPGVIGNVGQTLGEAKVNIAQFALARDRARGEALALVNIDSPASPEVLERLRKLPNIRRVHQVAL